MILPSSLVPPSYEQPGSVQTCARTLFLFSSGWTVEPPASCERCTAPLLRSSFSPAQPWARQDAPFAQGGDGETPCLKVRSDEVRDGPSWRSQAAADRAVSPLAEAVVTRPTSTLPRAQGLTRLIHPISGVRVRRAQEVISPCLPHTSLAFPLFALLDSPIPM